MFVFHKKITFIQYGEIEWENYIMFYRLLILYAYTKKKKRLNTRILLSNQK